MGMDYKIEDDFFSGFLSQNVFGTLVRCVSPRRGGNSGSKKKNVAQTWMVDFVFVQPMKWNIVRFSVFFDIFDLGAEVLYTYIVYMAPCSQFASLASIF